MRISILTICPEMFGDFKNTPLISRAVASGLLELEVIDIVTSHREVFVKWTTLHTAEARG